MSDTDLEEIDYPYPKKGDSFFKTDDEKVLHTHFITGNWAVYAEAYKEAADLLVEQVTGAPADDALVCPIVFLYRHYLHEFSQKTGRLGLPTRRASSVTLGA